MRRIMLLLIVLAACSPAPSSEQNLPTIAILPTGTPVPTVIALAPTVEPTFTPTEALSCPKLVSDAMSLVASNCADLNRDEICYGNVNLNVEPHSNATAFTFEKTGDITQVSNIANLRLSSMDLTQNAWGVAMMKIAANVPETLPGQGVTFLLFGDVEIEPSEEAGYGPMQAFYFKTGFRDRPCAEAPDSGLLIQTPQGTTKISLLVNEVQIELGSTVYLQAQPNGEMRVNTVEGSASVSASGVTQPAPAGTFVTVPLDANAIAVGPPAPPQPYKVVDLAALPLLVLPDSVAINPALSAAEIQAAIATQSDTSYGLLPGFYYVFQYEQDDACENETVFVDADGSLYINGAMQPFPQEAAGVYHRVTAGGTDLGTYTVSGTQVTFTMDADGVSRDCSGSISAFNSIFHFPADNACNVVEFQSFIPAEADSNSADILSMTGERATFTRESPTVYSRTTEDGRIERYTLSTVMQVQYTVEDGASGAVICSVDGRVEPEQGG